MSYITCESSFAFQLATFSYLHTIFLFAFKYPVPQKVFNRVVEIDVCTYVVEDGNKVQLHICKSHITYNQMSLHLLHL